MTTTENKLPELEGEPVEISIDGEKYEAPAGANLLEFMIGQGIEVPYFCYHPGLAVVAVCRQCLVELKGMPKLVPACQTNISEGMDIINSSEKVLDARRQLLEFTLVNHPVDCPICDKAGECILQKQYQDWDHAKSRTDHAKVSKPKAVDVGARIVLDDERCILCTRCVRFMRDVAKEEQLCISHRGNHAVLSTAPGHRFDSNYSLNTVDICPVGALTDKDFRFKVRVWELSSVNSVCNGCATGCRCEVHTHRNDVKRLVPRRYEDINLNWMCDYGRYTYKALTDRRNTLPFIQGKEAGWDEALDFVGKALEKLHSAGDGGKVGVVLGADATNEDNYVAAQLGLEYLEAGAVYLAAEPDGKGDDFLRVDDPNPNRAGAAAVAGDKLKSSADLASDLKAGKLKALLVVGDKLHLPEAAQAKLQDLDLLVVQAAHPGAVADKAGVLLPAAMWAEVDGTMVNAEGAVQRLRAAVEPPAFARPHWQILVQAARKAGFTLDYAGVKQVHEAMKKEIEPLRGAEWGKDLPPTLLRYAGSRG